MFTSKGPDLVVASGATASNAIYADGNYEGALDGILILAPAVVPEVGVIQVTDGVSAGDTTNVWRTLQNETPADVASPTAGKARMYKELPKANGFRILLAVTAAARTYNTSLVFVE